MAPKPVPAPKTPRPVAAPLAKKLAPKPPVVRKPAPKPAARPAAPTSLLPPVLSEQAMRHQADAYARSVLGSSLAGVPSVGSITQQVTAFPQRQIQDIGGMSSALLNQLQGVQTHTVDLTGGLVAQQQNQGAGIAQQANAAAIAAGGAPVAAPTAQQTGAQALGAYGATAANEVAQTLPAVAASQGLYQRAIEQRTQDALNTALQDRQQQVSQINAQRPSVFGDFYQQLANRNFQTGVAQQNYDIAQNEFGLKKGAAIASATTAAGKAALDTSKAAETARHNRASEANAAARAKVAAANADRATQQKNLKAYDAAWTRAQKTVDDALKGQTTKGTSRTIKGYNVSYYVPTLDPNTNKTVLKLQRRTVGPDWKPPPGAKNVAKQANYDTSSTTTTTGRSYYAGVKAAVAIMKAAGTGLSDAEITRLVQSYANPKFGGKYGAPGGKKPPPKAAPKSTNDGYDSPSGPGTRK